MKEITFLLPQAIRVLRVAAYCRVSTKHPDQYGTAEVQALAQFRQKYLFYSRCAKKYNPDPKAEGHERNCSDDKHRRFFGGALFLLDIFLLGKGVQLLMNFLLLYTRCSIRQKQDMHAGVFALILIE